jgi:hypothetical protein
MYKEDVLRSAICTKRTCEEHHLFEEDKLRSTTCTVTGGLV